MLRLPRQRLAIDMSRRSSLISHNAAAVPRAPNTNWEADYESALGLGSVDNRMFPGRTGCTSRLFGHLTNDCPGERNLGMSQSFHSCYRRHE